MYHPLWLHSELQNVTCSLASGSLYCLIVCERSMPRVVTWRFIIAWSWSADHTSCPDGLPSFLRKATSHCVGTSQWHVHWLIHVSLEKPRKHVLWQSLLLLVLMPCISTSPLQLRLWASSTLQLLNDHGRSMTVNSGEARETGFLYQWGVPRRQPHRRSGLATLPSVGAIP